MVEIALILEFLVATSTIVAASAAIGIYRRVSSVVETVERHERTLYGVNDEWEGLVSRVASHEAELEEQRDEQ